MEVAIHKLATQYRLPAAALVEREKLDRVRNKALDDAFRAALHHAGIEEDAELCIRSLFVPVRLHLNKSDEALAANWSSALSEEIGRVLRHGPTTNLVIYYSRRQALVDMAAGVARGDLRRAWAWRQLGLWGTSRAVSDAAAVGELVSALLRAPQMIVPVLNALAGFGWLHSVAARFEAKHWEALGRAVLYDGRGAGLPEVMQSPSARAVPEARRVLNASPIVRAVLAQAVRALDVNARRGIAVLAIMEADPGLLHRHTAPTVINLVAAALASPTSLESAFDARTLATGQESQSTETTAASETADAVDEVDANTPHAGRTSAKRPQDSHPLLSQSEREASEPAGGRSPKSVADPWPKQSPDEKTELLDLRRRAISRFAGLLYLIAVIQDLELPEQIDANELLGQRPFAWVLHQLALLLAPIEASDPAALAFAGLAPDATPTWKDEAPPTEAETHVLNAFADQIVTRLAALFETDDIAGVSPLAFVTQRRGEIVADPGWLEVRFSVDDVSTEIRRAGLDLNPGYVPWLGLVVMFVYE